MFYYYQIEGGEEAWKAVPASQKNKILVDHNPTFVTVLSVSKLVEDLPYEERIKLKYEGPLYFDWDGTDIAIVTEKVQSFIKKLEDMRFDMSMARLYATGGKGFHLEIPMQCFMEKIPTGGVSCLPTIYREIAQEMFVDTLDLRVYSQGRGRMWRTPGKLRTNGKHKVRITLAEMREMTVELYDQLTAAPRNSPDVRPAELCIDLSLMFTKCEQRVTDKMKKRAKSKPDPHVKDKATGPSIGLMMMGQGLKDNIGFHQIAIQLAIAATTAGTDLDKFIEQSAGIIEHHAGDGYRYNTPQKRRDELRRMYHYVDGNPMYDFSVGAIKVLLVHDAPDLDGINVDAKEVMEAIDDVNSNKAATEAGAPAGEAKAPDEYADVASGANVTRFGIYVTDGDFGSRRVSAISFTDTILLLSTENGKLVGYDAQVLVNGKPMGKQQIELAVWENGQNFNKFCAQYGHAYTGTELQLKAAFMRFIEQAKRKGNMQYIAKREGLDVVTIPNHDDEELRKPFMIWADERGVRLDPRVQGKGLSMKFSGYPDPKGIYRVDLADAPKLSEWIESETNKLTMQKCITGLFGAYESGVAAKLIGWYTACFWRMLFHKAYAKFPLLHVVGQAGAGKTEGQLALLSLFYNEVEPKAISPTSSLFSIQQHISASASIPLFIDEYKTETMGREQHGKIKLMLRDVYNCRTVSKGGGTRENEDYRSLSQIQLSAPVLFVSEAVESETATLERVVLVTMVRPPTSINFKRKAHFDLLWRNKQCLTILGQWLAAKVLNSYSIDQLRTEFDAMYEEARLKYMYTEADKDAVLDDEQMQNKQGAKERLVYNYTVTRFGFQQFAKLVNDLYGDTFSAKMVDMENSIYSKMDELQKSTLPEYLKVLSAIAHMSHSTRDTAPDFLRPGEDYGVYPAGGEDMLELDPRSVYMKYRVNCRQASVVPLFPSHESFIMALKDAASLVSVGVGRTVKRHGIHTFKMNDLIKLGVQPFKS